MATAAEQLAARREQDRRRLMAVNSGQADTDVFQDGKTPAQRIADAKTNGLGVARQPVGNHRVVEPVQQPAVARESVAVNNIRQPPTNHQEMPEQFRSVAASPNEPGFIDRTFPRAPAEGVERRAEVAEADAEFQAAETAGERGAAIGRNTRRSVSHIGESAAAVATDIFDVPARGVGGFFRGIFNDAQGEEIEQPPEEVLQPIESTAEEIVTDQAGGGANGSAPEDVTFQDSLQTTVERRLPRVPQVDESGAAVPLGTDVITGDRVGQSFVDPNERLRPPTGDGDVGIGLDRPPGTTQVLRGMRVTNDGAGGLRLPPGVNDEAARSIASLGQILGSNARGIEAFELGRENDARMMTAGASRLRAISDAVIETQLPNGNRGLIVTTLDENGEPQFVTVDTKSAVSISDQIQVLRREVQAPDGIGGFDQLTEEYVIQLVPDGDGGVIRRQIGADVSQARIADFMADTEARKLIFDRLIAEGIEGDDLVTQAIEVWEEEQGRR